MNNFLYNICSNYATAANTKVQNTITASVDILYSYTKHKIIHKIKSTFGYELHYDYDDPLTQQFKVLQALDPKKFKANSYVTSRNEYKLRKFTHYVINLTPRLKAAIYVSAGNNDDDYESADTLNLFFFGPEAQRACNVFLNSMNSSSVTLNSPIITNKVDLYSIDYEGQDKDTHVNYMGKIYAKTFDQLFIEDSNKNHIISYCDKWMEAANLFASYGISYKAGILLYGPPGTGKSSLAKTLGTYLGTPVYVVNMATFSPDIIKTIQTISNNKIYPFIVLLEDIDYIFGKRTQDRTPQEKANGNAILQLLDGVNGVSNVIFIATTNDISSLDAAICREGRFDIKINVDNISKDMAENMIHGMNVTNHEAVAAILQDETFPINPAHLQNKVIHYVFDHLDEFSFSTEGNL